jgi:hypothetical protein
VTSYAALAAELAPLGFVPRGGFHPGTDDGVPCLLDGSAAATLILVGSVGRALWQLVRGSSEPDPIARHTRRAVTPLAARFDAEALFPFGGPPWHPFQRWAIRAETLERSPLGLLIHPEYGLWHAYRAALLFREAIALPKPAPGAGPCSRCPDRPCLSACPAEAISERGYDVAACRAHLGSHPAASCWQGCIARRACPVGTTWAHAPEQAVHHMRHFGGPQR